MGTYIESYVYDAVGNLSEMQHRRTLSSRPAWTRHYAYEETSLIEDGTHGTLLKTSNRLSSTTVMGNHASTEPYAYDNHGNMTNMPHLRIMQWDYKDQLFMTQRQEIKNQDDEEGARKEGERTYYTYESSGQRVRKVTKLTNGNLKDERVYLNGFELYRSYSGSDAGLVRETLHIMDDKRRIALVETRTDVEDSSPEQLIRYQFGNHLDSALLELDDQAQIISYEEYTPYGSTSYQAVRSRTETRKRYRYTGKERDEESGFYYHGARYYASWLGRWTSVDPAALKASAFEHTIFQPYVYVENKPVVAVDQDGEGIMFVAAAVGAGVGAVVGGVIEAGRQYMTTGKVSDWAAVTASVFGGAVAGAVTGLTLGRNLAIQATAAAMAGVAGGATTRALTGQQQTLGSVVQDAAIGLLTFGIIRGTSAAISALRGGGSTAASSGTRTVATEAAEAARPAAPAAPGTRATTSSGLRSATTEAAEAARPAAPAAPGTRATTAPAVPQSAHVGPAAVPQGQAYRIGEGVRRATVAREAGLSEIEAVIRGEGGSTTQRITLDRLFVTPDKSTIMRDPRWLNLFRSIASEGQRVPIEVFPISPSQSQQLVPVQQIRLLRFRGL